MTFYFAMINAWSLAWDVLNGTMDEEYPIIDTSVGAGNTAFAHGIDGHYEIDDGLDYEVDGWESDEDVTFSSSSYNDDYMADIDDQYSHHFTSEEIYDAVWGDGIKYTTYDDGMSLQVKEEQMSAHYFKYHEKEILKDIEEYVSRTYQGHYTGKSHEYRNVQTLDLMAAKELASGFCQANILKYGSRYGNKDGKNTKDLMKVIHYAMLLLHFDGHYGKPSMSTGNIDQIDHNMP